LVPKRDVRPFDLEVVDLQKDRITLRVTFQTKNDDWRRDGIWGLRWNGGYAQVGKIQHIDTQKVVRKFVPLTGNLKRGDMVRLDAFAFPDDPQQAFGLPTQKLVFSSPLGVFHGWFIAAHRNTWVIFVHGKRDHPPRKPLHAYPIIPVVAKIGLPSMIITYRNDLGAPASPDGYHWYGLTEWKDLEGAARYAVEHGAEKLILVGYSMGGAVVMNFLYRSPLAEKVRCAILDSPMLNLSATIDFGGRLIGLPDFLISLGKLTAGIRFNIDWKALDYLRRTNELRVPNLLFHGDADTTVPVETSEALAKARPDIVSYHRVPGATHIRSWNMNPAAYETAVHNFLTPEK
jgi:pimeloyl-ACP methyl ester carboxylesterase